MTTLLIVTALLHVTDVELMKRGEGAESRGEPELALEAWKRLIDEHLTSELRPTAMHRSIGALWSLGRLNDAGELSLRYADEYPDDAQRGVRLVRAASFFERAGNDARAVQVYTRALEHRLGRLELIAARRLGDSLQRLGRSSEARDAYARAVAAYVPRARQWWEHGPDPLAAEAEGALKALQRLAR